MTRDKILSEAIDNCIKELYTLVVPKITWEEFKEECKNYSNRYQTWKNFRRAQTKKNEFPQEWEHQKTVHPNWENKSITECIGACPYEFYFLPKEIMKDICDSYIYAYKLDHQQELLDTIETLKNYCKEPIVDKYINDWTDETGFHHPGYRGYDHPDNIEKEIKNYLISNYDINLENVGIEGICNIFYKFLDMAGNFFSWNRDLNTFNISVYLGPSPNPNKEAVIENWKKYKGVDISIDEEQIKKDFYGEDELD